MINQERLQRVIGEMKRRELDQLIISDPLSIRYLTQIYVEPFERLWALLLSKDGKACLFANNLFVLPENELETVWYSDSEDSVGKIAERIIPGRLGIDKLWPARFLIPLQERLKNTVTVLGSDCVDDCRAIKDHDEIRRMREASRINDIVMETASRHVREGMSEKEVAGFIRNEYLKYGCQGVSFAPIVSFGANGADPHHEPDDTILKRGDAVLFDIGCLKDDYCSDMTRTYFYGKVTDKQKMIHDLVRKANETAESIIKPGVRLCDIDAAARNVISEAGYGKYFTHRLGHFIGQKEHEQGDVSSTNTAEAKPGMIFSIEPGIYLPGEFGVRIEDLVLVTEEGCEVLNQVDKHCRIIDNDRS